MTGWYPKCANCGHVGNRHFMGSTPEEATDVLSKGLKMKDTVCGMCGDESNPIPVTEYPNENL